MIDVLVELARCEMERLDTRHRLDGDRARLEFLAELGRECEEDAVEAEGEAVRSTVNLRHQEARIAELETALERKRGQLAAAGEAKQRQALEREMAALQERIDRDFEEYCRLSGETEDRRGDADRARTDRDDRRRQGDGEQEAILARRGLLEAAAAEIDQEIARLQNLLPDGIRRQIDRLWSRGLQAVVTVSGQACGGCFALLTPQQAIAADQGKDLVRCPSCSRFVVHPPWQ
ncbi:MAG: zinc ribbon domain-containing protein [Candidatus Krumholzibacteriia bacterium]